MSELTNTFTELQVLRERFDECITWVESLDNLGITLTLVNHLEGRNHPAPKMIERDLTDHLRSNANAIIAAYLESLLDEITAKELKFRQLSSQGATAFPELSKRIDAIKTKTL